MRPHSGTLYSIFKYSVYTLLTLNIFLFFAEEYQAALTQFSDGIPAADFIEAFASTIDTAAWVVLLLMFELETYILDDRTFTPRVTWSLRLLRTLCYAIIVYAFYGYVANLWFTFDTSPLAAVDNLCSLPADWSWTITLDEYAALTRENCATFSTAAEFYRFNGLDAAIDAATLADVRELAWIDVINGGVWILVVVLLEIDVFLQERGLYEGWALTASTATKVFLYGTLLIAVFFWMWKGDFKDWWDAFLWLIAFVFIELNVFEWRSESHREVAAPAGN